MRSEFLHGILMVVALSCLSIQAREPVLSLSMGIDDSPPYSYFENQQPKGTLVEMVQRLSKQIELEVQFVACPWARCIRLVELGELDLLAGLAKTSERQQSLLFIDPPIFKQQATFRFFKVNPHLKIEKHSDLNSLIIGKLRGSMHFNEFDQDASLITHSSPNIENLFWLLQNGRIDAFIHIEQTLDPYLQQYDPEKLIQPSELKVETLAYGFLVMSKKSVHIEKAMIISQALSKMKNQGILFTLSPD